MTVAAKRFQSLWCRSRKPKAASTAFAPRPRQSPTVCNDQMTEQATRNGFDNEGTNRMMTALNTHGWRYYILSSRGPDGHQCQVARNIEKFGVTGEVIHRSATSTDTIRFTPRGLASLASTCPRPRTTRSIAERGRGVNFVHARTCTTRQSKRDQGLCWLPRYRSGHKSSHR